MITNTARRQSIGLWVFLKMCLLFVTCCATTQVGWDLMEYVNQGILSIAELERRPLEKYSLARGKNFTTDQELCRVLKEDVIPEYRLFLELLKQIQPETKEVRKLHYLHVQGTQHIYRGLKIKMVGLENNDTLLIQAANKEIELGKRRDAEWQKKLVALFQEHGIEYSISSD